MDTAAQWPPHQDIVVKPMDQEIVATCPKERKVRPQKEQALNCPRCNSTNTKFCYYNNYSLTQPRYFCKTCRRYWTEGGSLRNIPVGGGSRKNKRSSSSQNPHATSSSSSSQSNINSKIKLPDHLLQQNPKIQQPQDLNLGFSIHHPHHHHEMIQVPSFENPSSSSPPPPPPPPSLSPLELLTGFTASRGLSSFMPPSSDPNSVYSSGFPSLPDFKPSLNFSLDGLGSNYGSFQGVQQPNGKILFPFQDLKSNTNEGDDQQNRDGDNNASGYWNGVIGGGSW